MPVDCTQEGRVLRARVTGELDHHRAKEVMAALDRQIDLVLPVRLTVDLSELTFTDSSGIAVLLAACTGDRRTDVGDRRARPGPPGISGSRAGQADPVCLRRRRV